MSIKYILFDLDGTLLPMDQDIFVNTYFKLLAKKLELYGYEPQALIGNIWAGTKAMIKNDGSVSNEEAFWNTFSEFYGEEVKNDIPVFDEFYRNEFQQVQSVCGYEPKAAQTVTYAKEKGFRVVLATNPLFPSVATESRIRWAGLSQDDFELYTTYENSKYCKPNPNYYKDILAELGAKPEECLMVGNDVAEDMIAESLGMKVFLLTDCLINKENKDIEAYSHGSFDELCTFIETITE